jgi:histidyl-tRNA synthetase
MKVPVEPLRGFRDILPPDSTELRTLMNIFVETASKHGYLEVIPPTLERFELFALKSGEEIKRSMFVFKDKAGREVALRPEATASIARIYLKHLRAKPKPLRLFYIVNCFRYEEPQKARYREFWQAGIELLGAEGLSADIETIDVLLDYYRKLGIIDSIILKLGNIALYRKVFNKYGVPEEEQDHILHLMDKKLYNEAAEYLAEKGYEELSQKLKNIWNNKDNLEKILHIVEQDGQELVNEIKYLVRIADILRNTYPNLSIDIDIAFARGLAYYTGIIFEVKVPGFPVSIAGGGRYDNLIEIYGDEHVPGVGFAIGLDRTLIAMKEIGKTVPIKASDTASILIIGEELLGYAISVKKILIEKGIVTTISIVQKLSKMLSKLSESGVRYAIIIGKKERDENKVTIKDLSTREQVTVSLDELEAADEISAVFKR